jgi:hypothetical protein
MGWFWKRFRGERGKLVLPRDMEKDGHGMPCPYECLGIWLC